MSIDPGHGEHFPLLHGEYSAIFDQFGSPLINPRGYLIKQTCALVADLGVHVAVTEFDLS